MNNNKFVTLSVFEAKDFLVNKADGKAFKVTVSFGEQYSEIGYGHTYSQSIGDFIRSNDNWPGAEYTIHLLG